jgi:plastocyanin/mono/diheme cytochrome c family protein
MENTRNQGFPAVVVGMALAVLFTLLGLTQVLDGRIAYGLALICGVTAALVYIAFSRGNAIAKTGYASLVFIIAVGLFIPVQMVNQQQAQATATQQQYDLTLHRGAGLFGQYCATCHGYLGQGINGPKLNNNPDVNKLTDDDLTRIISAGIPGDPADPATLAMPAWLDTYGGSLTEDDISYLVAFIRSSDPNYLKTKGLPSVNGFGYVRDTLTAAQQKEYDEQKKGGGKPPASQFKDMTGQSAVDVPIENTTGGAAQWGFTPQYITIKAGTTVTWTNKSSAPHTVYTRPGTTPPATFKSDILAAGTGTYSFKFTKAGDYPYYCSLHPAMLAWITVVP